MRSASLHRVRDQNLKSILILSRRNLSTNRQTINIEKTIDRERTITDYLSPDKIDY